MEDRLKQFKQTLFFRRRLKFKYTLWQNNTQFKGGLYMSKISIEKDKLLFPCIKRWSIEELLTLTDAKGSIVRDENGKEYIDLWANHGAAVIGHCHPKVVQALKEQAEKIIHATYDFNTIPTIKLAEKLAQIVPKNLSRFYFLNSGAEAVECSIYTARRKTGKYEIIALYGAFHGRSYGARSLIGWSKYKRGGGPYLPGVLHVPSYYCYRCTFGLEYPQCGLLCARILRDVLIYQSAGDVAAFIAEPILGSAGNIPPPKGYWEEVKKILDENDILLIDDEVITGFRTGKMFAIEHFNIEPDLMTFAKGLGGGFPIYAVAASEEVASSLQPMDYFSTFGGNPLGCAAALATIDVILSENLVEKSRILGEYFIKRLKELAERHELIGDVRGVGLLIGVELVKDLKTKDPAVSESIKLREEARKRGLILPAGWGWLGNVIRINPPLNITREQIDKSIEIIDQSLKAIKTK
jgi:4-aminobutyrate aminotransferase-like enzyme